MNPTSEVGRKATGDVAIRHNKIQMSGAGAIGMNFAAVTGLVTGPGAVPEWDIRMLFENNCVQDTEIGFAVVDVFGAGYSTETYDLGGGGLGSLGYNKFLRTAVDVVFARPIIPSAPATVPSSVLAAENNYWDANHPFAANPLEAFVVDEVGGAMFDTEPFRTSGPVDCGIDTDN